MNGTELVNKWLNTRTKEQLINLIKQGQTWNSIYFGLIGDEE